MDWLNTGYTKINTSLITTTSYTDSNVYCETTYYYKISSVNIDDIEGTQSSYVSITTASRVVSSFSSPGGIPHGLAFDGTYLWNAAPHADKIYKIDPTDGSVLSSFPSPGSYPFGLAFDGTYLWVADLGEEKIYKLYISDL